jgi:uncharacterized RDD family membrane protein YckC
MTIVSISPAPQAIAPRDAVGSVNAGLVTRILAFAVDAAIVNTVAWFVGVVAALCLSVITVPDTVTTALVAIGAVAALVWALAYFTFFWTTTGQTPGNRLVRIEVLDATSGAPLRARRALARIILLPLSVIPLCAGLLLILVDRRRRAPHDCLVGSVVSFAPEVARTRRAVR